MMEPLTFLRECWQHLYLLTHSYANGAYLNPSVYEVLFAFPLQVVYVGSYVFVVLFRLLIRAFVMSFLCSFVRSYVRSLDRLVVRSFVRVLVRTIV